MAETAAAYPIQLARMIAFMRDPAQGMQLQQQQALADQMMTEGAQQPDPNAMVSGHVVPFNPWGGAARMGERMLGAEMTKENNQKLAQMMQAGQQQNQPQGGQGQALGNAMGGGGAPTAQDIMYGQIAPVWQKAQYDRANALAEKGMMEVNGQIVPIQGYNPSVAATAGGIKGAEAGATLPYETVTGPGGVQMPKSTIVQPQGNPAITPQSPAGQQALGDMYGTQPVGQQQANVMPNPVAGTTPGYNPNDPVQYERQKAQVTKEGENIADAQKNVAAVNSGIDNQIANLNTLKALSKKMPYGSAADAELWGSRNIGTHIGGGQYDKSWQDFNTLNKQMFVNGLMGSIPPGSRLDIPIVKSLQAAKEVDPYASPGAREAVINRHIETLLQAKQNAENNYGILSGKVSAQPSAAPSSSVPSAVTHVWTPNGIMPVGGQ